MLALALASWPIGDLTVYHQANVNTIAVKSKKMIKKKHIVFSCQWSITVVFSKYLVNFWSGNWKLRLPNCLVRSLRIPMALVIFQQDFQGRMNSWRLPKHLLGRIKDLILARVGFFDEMGEQYDSVSKALCCARNLAETKSQMLPSSAWQQPMKTRKRSKTTDV